MSGSLRGLRIGYVPYSRDMSAPSDRRRFCRWAKLRDVSYEVFRPGGRYDVVYLGTLADITTWSRMPRGDVKVVYDLSDSYLDVDPGELRARLRGPAKFALRQHRHLEWSYHESLARMCERADAVICSTPEQRRRIQRHSQNVHPILDFHDATSTRVKTDYAIGQTLNLVWEGQGANAFTLGEIAAPLRELAARRPLALHLVTDLKFRAVNGPVPRMSVKSVVERLLPRVRTYLYEWNELALSVVATACDLALIPMVRTPPIYWSKAENKLLIFWRMGVPVLTAPTPAYARTMAAADLPLTCADASAWSESLTRLSADEPARRQAAEKGKLYAENEHGTDALARRWDAVAESLFTTSRRDIP